MSYVCRNLFFLTLATSKQDCTVCRTFAFLASDTLPSTHTVVSVLFYLFVHCCLFMDATVHVQVHAQLVCNVRVCDLYILRVCEVCLNLLLLSMKHNLYMYKQFSCCCCRSENRPKLLILGGTDFTERSHPRAEQTIASC